MTIEGKDEDMLVLAFFICLCCCVVAIFTGTGFLIVYRFHHTDCQYLLNTLSKSIAIRMFLLIMGQFGGSIVVNI